MKKRKKGKRKLELTAIGKEAGAVVFYDMRRMRNALEGISSFALEERE